MRAGRKIGDRRHRASLCLETLSASGSATSFQRTRGCCKATRGSRPVRFDRRVIACVAQFRRDALFRIDHPQGRKRRAGICHGLNTYFGRTAQLVQEAHTVSHFQRAVLKIGDYLIVLAVVLVVLILIVALFRGDQMTTTLQFALVLTVAAIPVAMPTVLSVTMAVGARVLAVKQAIVSRLAAIEELAGMDVFARTRPAL